MNKTILSVAAIATVAGAIAVPSIAIGNARRTEGTLASMQAAQTPYTADLLGSNEVGDPGDPDGNGVASVSFDVIDAATTEVCWDMSLFLSDDPVAAHIHEGAADAAGGVVVDFGAPTPDSFSGCVEAPTDDVQPIIDDPADYYVNVHNGDFPNGAIRGQLSEGAASAGAAHFLPTPLRVFDSRDLGDKIAAGEANTETVGLTFGADPDDNSLIAVPPGATAAIITLTATETDGPGFLSVYSAASPLPTTSNLNYATAGAVVAVTTTVAVDETGSINVTAGAAGTHYIIDVVGFHY